MIRSYKVLGLAVLAMLAFGAFMAQGASAVPLTCEVPEKATCYTLGDQGGGVHEFKSAGGTVSCSEASFVGESVAGAGGAINEQTVTPNYATFKAGTETSNCVAFGFAAAHVKMNECSYTFTTPSQVAGGPTGEVTWGKEQLHLVCPSGKQIEITPTSFGISVCTQFVGTQTPKGGHVVSTNSGTSEKMDLLLHITLSEVATTGTGGPCGTNALATLTGTSTVKCYSDKAREKQVGCTYS